MFREEQLAQIKEKEATARKAYLEGEDELSPSDDPGEFEINELQAFKELLGEDLRAAEPITLGEIIELYRDRLGKGRKVIEKMIETLVEEEFLDKEGYGKRATYELNPVASYPNQH